MYLQHISYSEASVQFGIMHCKVQDEFPNYTLVLLWFKCVFSKKCQNTLSSLSPEQLLLNLKCQDGNDDDDDDDDDGGDDDNKHIGED